jgi:hypothetical protein
VLPEKVTKAIKRADQVAAWFEATRLAGFSEAEAAKFFGRPRGFDGSALDLACKPANAVQKVFLRRFNAIEAMRRR